MASKQQTKLIKVWQHRGYTVINLVRVTPIGLPDLIAVKPDDVVFIESKEVWDKLSQLQKTRLKMLKLLGFKCYVNDEEY